MKLTEEQMKMMLNAIAKEAVWYLRGSAILRVFEGIERWSDVFEKDGETGILVKVLENNMELDSFFDEVVHDHVADRIAESLGAKKVTIKW